MCRGSLAWLGRQTHNLESHRAKRLNPEVAGSNPAPGTIFLTLLKRPYKPQTKNQPKTSLIKKQKNNSFSTRQISLLFVREEQQQLFFGCCCSIKYIIFPHSKNPTTKTTQNKPHNLVRKTKCFFCQNIIPE